MSWIYETNEDNTARYIIGETGSNPMICFGINPSYAEPTKLDPTIRQIKKLTEIHNYDGWIMLNVYPKRSTNPNLLEDTLNRELHNENLKYINDVINTYKPKEVFSLWGNVIDKRLYLRTCLKDINRSVVKSKIKWKYIGGVTKDGNPWHPRTLFLENNKDKTKNYLEKVYDISF